MLVRSARLFLIYTLEAIAVLMALAIFAAALLLWRLASGPVDVDAVVAGLRPAIATALGGEEARYGSASIRYAPGSRALVVDMRALEVDGPGGAVLATAEQVELALALDQLVIGRIRPVEINAVGGVFTVRRDVSGVVSASLGGRTAQAGGTSGDDAAGTVLARLQRARISGAELRVEDAISGLSARFADAELALERDGRAVQVSANAGFLAPAGAVPVAVELETGANFDTMFLAFSAQGLVPSTLGNLQGVWGRLGAFDVPLDVDLVLDASRSAGLRAVELTLDAGAGVFRGADGVMGIESAHVSASLDAAGGELELRALQLDSELLRLDVSGRLHGFAGYDNLVPSRARYELVLGEGELILPDTLQGPFAWSRGAFSGRLDTQSLELFIDSGEAEFLDVTASLSGRLGLDETEDGRRPAIRIEGDVEGVIRKDAVLALWPVEFALGGRDWVEANVLAGEARNLRADINIPAEAFNAGMLDDEDLTVSFDFSNATARYISTMTPLTGLSGSAVLRGNSLGLTGHSGRIDALEIDALFVEIPRFNPRGAPARFGGEGRGSLSGLVALLDQPPLNLASDYGFDPQALEGEGAVRFEITRPMLRDVPYEDIGFDVSGRFSGAAGPSGLGEVRFSEGDISFQADSAGLEASGDVRIGRSQARLEWRERFQTPEGELGTRVRIVSNADARDLDLAGIPARGIIDGQIGLDATFVGNGLDFSRYVVMGDLTDAAVVLPENLWTKPRGLPAALEMVAERSAEGGLDISRLAVLGDEVDIRGQARLAADGLLLSAGFERVVVGCRSDLAISASRPDGSEGPLDIRISGRFLDASDLISNLVSGRLFSGEGAGAVSLIADVETVQAGRVRYGAVGLALESDAQGLQRLNLQAALPRGEISLAVAPQPDGMRLLSARSADAGAVLTTLGGFGTITGGTMELEGLLPPAGTPGGVQGRLLANGFRLEQMPLLARILAAGSLEGLGSLFSGQGIDFERLEVDYAFADGLLEMREGRVAGPSLGLTWTGVVDTAGERMNLSGTILPSYGLNSVLGNLPVVGELLTSRRGEGIVGVTFAAEGPFDATRVSANPLSALAPGVFRRMFEGTSALRELDALEARRREEAAQATADAPRDSSEDADDSAED
ncbi:MAG: YhdP family protein [Glycocaulis sp.]